MRNNRVLKNMFEVKNLPPPFGFFSVSQLIVEAHSAELWPIFILVYCKEGDNRGHAPNEMGVACRILRTGADSAWPGVLRRQSVAVQDWQLTESAQRRFFSFFLLFHQVYLHPLHVCGSAGNFPPVGSGSCQSWSKFSRNI